MRVLFTSVTAYGHLHPLMPLARAAVAAGDEVLVATGRDMQGWVAACGVPHVRAGREESDPGFAHEEAWLAEQGPERAFHLFSTVLAPPMVRDLLSLCAEWRPDVLVHEETEMAGPLVASVLGVPCATHSYAAPARPLRDRGVFLELLGPVWAEHTDAAPRIVGDLYLDGCPPAFQTDAVEVIPNVLPVRPIGFDGPPEQTPAWLDAVRRPAAYLTFGTVAVFSRVEVLQQAMDAVAPLVETLVVTTGPNPPDALRPPANTVVAQYVPQSAILGAVDLVVSHGGAGTTLGAIEHALPHVVMPQQPFSQMRNAERVEALAIGRHVAQDDYEALGPAVRSVLDDPTYAHNAAAVLASFDELPAPDQVLAELRRLAG